MFPRARTPTGEIEGAGGAYVRRRFSFGDRNLVAGDTLSAEDIASIPDANLRSLINLNNIELFPAPPETSVIEQELRTVITEKNTEIKRLETLLKAEPLPASVAGDCFLMPDETGKKFHIIQGRQVTDEPLNRAQATAKMKELTSS